MHEHVRAFDRPTLHCTLSKLPLSTSRHWYLVKQFSVYLLRGIVEKGILTVEARRMAMCMERTRWTRTIVQGLTAHAIIAWVCLMLHFAWYHASCLTERISTHCCEGSLSLHLTSPERLHKSLQALPWTAKMCYNCSGWRGLGYSSGLRFREHTASEIGAYPTQCTSFHHLCR